MKIENLCHVVFTDDELKDALLCQLECVANDEIPGSPKHERLMTIVNHARQNYCDVDLGEDGVVLMINGVAITDEL